MRCSDRPWSACKSSPSNGHKTDSKAPKISKMSLLGAYILFLQAVYFENSGNVKFYCRTPNHRKFLVAMHCRTVSRDPSSRLYCPSMGGNPVGWCTATLPEPVYGTTALLMGYSDWLALFPWRVMFFSTPWLAQLPFWYCSILVVPFLGRSYSIQVVYIARGDPLVKEGVFLLKLTFRTGCLGSLIRTTVTRATPPTLGA